LRSVLVEGETSPLVRQRAAGVLYNRFARGVRAATTPFAQTLASGMVVERLERHWDWHATEGEFELWGDREEVYPRLAVRTRAALATIHGSQAEGASLVEDLCQIASELVESSIGAAATGRRTIFHASCHGFALPLAAAVRGGARVRDDALAILGAIASDLEGLAPVELARQLREVAVPQLVS